eukprot:256795_1
MNCIVIGAGPSGLACALGLSKVCEKVFLVEKYASFEKRGATFGMAKSGQLALEEISPDLMEHMREVGLKAGFSETLVFVWWEMRDAILNFVKQQPNIELYCGEDFTDIDDNADGVKVNFRSGLELTADFVVGADGVHSQVRTLLGLAPPIISETTLFRGSLQVPDTASTELKGCLEKSMVPLAVSEKGKIYFVLFNFNGRHPGRLAWVLSTAIDIQGNDDEMISPFSLAEDHVKEVEKLHLIKEVLSLSHEDHLKPYPKTSIVDISDEILETYGKNGGWGGRGRITLIGDAAHAMRPTDGLGGAMAMEDAVVLSRVLKSNVEKGDTVQNLLREYESERLPRVKRVYDNQCERYDTRMKEGKNPAPQSKEFMDWLIAGV